MGNLEEILESAGVVLWEADADTLKWNFVSREAEQLFGYPVSNWVDQPAFWLQIIHPQDRDKVLSLLSKAAERDKPLCIRYRATSSNGKTLWLKNLVRTMIKGSERKLVGSIVDITEEKEMEEMLEYRALHDPLTGLPNRLLLMDRLERLLAGLLRDRNASFALLFIDLDNFKQINDTFGHLVGDEIIAAIARRLEKSLRRSDTLSRIGGDEFVILAERVSSIQAARVAARRLLEALADPFLVHGVEMRISASIGITISKGSYREPAEILQEADSAMYSAKAGGGGNFNVYTSEPGEPAAVAS